MNLAKAQTLNEYLSKLPEFTQNYPIFTAQTLTLSDDDLNKILFLSTVLKSATPEDFEFLVTTLDFQSVTYAIQYFGIPGVILMEKLNKMQPHEILNVKQNETDVAVIRRKYTLLKDAVGEAQQRTGQFVAKEVYDEFLVCLMNQVEKSYQWYISIQQ